jgi:hypothetical protein
MCAQARARLKKTAMPQLAFCSAVGRPGGGDWRTDDPTIDIEIIELFQLHVSVPTNQHTFRTRNPHDSRIAAETPRGKDRPRNIPARFALVHASLKIGQLHTLYGFPGGRSHACRVT